jgi:hypothetical protein
MLLMSRNRQSRLILLLGLVCLWFASAGSKAAYGQNITFPTNGATNVDPYLTVAWGAAAGALSYSLNVGTTPGGSDVFQSGTLTTTSVFVPGLAQNTTYYLTLSTATASGTTSTSSSFTTGTGIAHITTPANGATNVSPFAAFTWTTPNNAQGYYVYVGTTPGGKDVDNSGSFSPTITSRVPQGLVGGQTYYATIFTEENGTWLSSSSISFTTAVQATPTNQASYWSNIESLVASVRMMTQGMTNTPQPGTLLAQWVAADGVSSAFCTEYARALEQLLLQQGISARIRHSDFDGPGGETHTFNEYYDLTLNKWVVADSDFGVVYLDPTAGTGMALSDVSANVVTQRWSNIVSSMVFVSSYGAQVFTAYYMDPILLFLNPAAPAAAAPPTPLPNSPVPFFVTQGPSIVGTPNEYVFSFVNSTDQVTISDPVKGTLVIGPASGSIYGFGVSLSQGWSIVSAPNGLGILTIERVITPASLTFPANAAKNVPTSPTLTWTPITTATYTLMIGSTAGASDIFNSGSITSTSVTVPNLQALTTYYVTLTTQPAVGNGQFTSTFTTAPILAQLSSPANGATNVLPNQPVLAWSSVADGQAYYVYIGSTQGAKDVASSGSLSGTSYTAPILNSATLYYVRLFTEIDSSWAYYVDTTFTTGVSPALITAPANNAKNVSTSPTLTWTTVVGATYTLAIGSTPGGSDVYNSGSLSTTSATVSNLRGLTTYYITLTTVTTAGAMQTTSQFTTAPVLAQLSFPANGATNVPPNRPVLTWSSVGDAQAYYVYIGSSQGAKDIANSGTIIGTSYTAPILNSGTSYWVRLFTEIGGSFSYYVDTTFTTGVSPALITAPANNAKNVSTSPTLTWTSVNGATYTLAIGSTPGGSDVYNSGSLSTTSATVSNLQGLTTYYVTLTTVSSAGSAQTTSQFTTAPVLAQLSSPANGATNISPVQLVLAWSRVGDAQAYYVYIGTSQGAKDVVNSGSLSTSTTSFSAPVLNPSSTYYIRLFTEIGGSWGYYVDSSFTTAAGTSFVSFPANHATNVDPYLTMTWSTVSNAQSYSVSIGTTAGGSNVFQSGPVIVTSLFVPGLQTNTTYYVTLVTTSAGGTGTSSMSFTTGYGIAHITSPVNGATNVSPFAPITWTSISIATGYYVWIGTTPLGRDVDNSGAMSPSATSMIPQGLIGGQTYYATMYTQENGNWFQASPSIQFTTAVQPVPTNQASYWANVESLVASVRMMTQGMTNNPIPGTLLAQFVAADNRTTAFCTEYAETLEQTLLSNSISARIRHSTFNGTNTEGHAFNEYYDLTLNKWVQADSDFGAVYLNTSAGTGMGLADINANVVAQNWSTIAASIVYVSTYGDQVFKAYYMDPILLFLNPLPPTSATITLPLANSPTRYLVEGTVGAKGFFVFSFVNQTDTVTISDPVKGTLTLGPNNGTIYSIDTGLNTGWSITSAPTGLGVWNIERVMF